MKINELSASEVLERALTVAGGKQRLCTVLWISEAELDGYLAGRADVTEAVYLGALDLLI